VKVVLFKLLTNFVKWFTSGKKYNSKSSNVSNGRGHGQVLYHRDTLTTIY